MFVRKSISQIVCSDKILYNTLSKTYRDGSKQILCASKRIFRETGWEDGCSTKLKQSRPLSNFELAEDRILSILCDISEDSDFPAVVLETAQEEVPVVEMSQYEIERLEEMDEQAARLARKKEFENLRRAIRRARVKVRDYALSTDLKWFVTLTLDKEKIDRKDIHVITRKLNRWLSNQVERKGLTYIMVPELHKDGSVHFHALFNDALPVVDSGTLIPRGGDKPKRPLSASQRSSWINQGARIVYNLPAWDYGFTTALQLEGNYEKAVNYVSKYISKCLSDEVIENGGPLPTKIGGRWYYSGGDLKSPQLEFFNQNIEEVADAFGSAAWQVDVQDMTDVQMLVIWIDENGIPRERLRKKKNVDDKSCATKVK